MVFSFKTEIRAYSLNAKGYGEYYPLLRRLKQAIGVAYDGQSVYWTDIYSENESILKARSNGTRQEVNKLLLKRYGLD